METLKKITNFVSKYMAVIVIAVAALALFAPNTVSFIKTSYVNTLLGIVMFGMGLTLKPNDFKVVFSRPKDVIIGCIAQFTVMPLLAFALTKVFQLPAELAIGVILVGVFLPQYGGRDQPGMQKCVPGYFSARHWEGRHGLGGLYCRVPLISRF